MLLPGTFHFHFKDRQSILPLVFIMILIVILSLLLSIFLICNVMLGMEIRTPLVKVALVVSLTTIVLAFMVSWFFATPFLRNLEENAFRFKKLFQNMNNGVAIYRVVEKGENILLQDINQAGEILCKASRDAIIGKSLLEISPSGRRIGLFDLLIRVWSSGLPERMTLHEDKGKEIIQWLEYYVFKLPSGEIVAIFDDLTEKHQAEEKRLKLEELLIQADKMESIGRLAGGIAHDFNNILQSLLGFAEMIDSGTEKGDPRKEYIEEIINSGRRAASLTSQLLAFGRKQMFELKIIDLNLEVRKAETMLRRIISENIKIETDLSPHLMPLKVDPSQIGQIIMNLAVNAKDAMPMGGTITFKTYNTTLNGSSKLDEIPERREGHFVVLSVSDTGSGMNKDIMNHIFEPFFTTKELSKSTGLGLSVIYGIASQHGGWIEAASEENKGSIFNVYLPAYLEKDSMAAISPKITGLPGNGRLILLVEDEEIVRKVAERTLKVNGYNVIVTKKITEAEDIFKEQKDKIDLIFSDVVLPDGNGVTMVSKMMTVKPGLKILLSSGYSSDLKTWEHLSQDSYPFIRKPYSINALLLCIDKIFKTPNP